MQYAIMAFVAILIFSGYKIHSWSYDAGFSASKAGVLEVKNNEIVQLNQDNEIIQNKLDRSRRNNQAKVEVLENVYKQNITEIERKKAIAVRDLTNALQLQLSNAKSGGENEANLQGEGATTYITGATGSEGSCLSPAARFNLEREALRADENTVLLGWCQDVIRSDREEGSIE